MRITKFVHSCLLVETDDHAVLFDPGEFSWESKTFTIDAFKRLDDIVITHEHADHMSMPFINALVAKFPSVTITTTANAADALKEAGIQASTKGHGLIEPFATHHESVAPLGEAPQNTGVHYKGLLTHPGDSHHFEHTKAVLALPVTAPWGSMMNAATLALQLKPQYIVPIHDWHWNDTARAQAYGRLKTFFADHDITFIQPVDGQAFDIAV